MNPVSTADSAALHVPALAQARRPLLCGAGVAAAWTCARAHLACLASLPFSSVEGLDWLPCVDELPEVPTC